MKRGLGIALTLFFGCISAQAQSIPKSYFGLNLNNVTSVSPWPKIPYGTARIWDACDSASNAGTCGSYPTGATCSGSNYWTYWTNIETENGVYNWGPLDAIVAKYQAKGLNIAYQIALPPGWATANGGCGGVPSDLTSAGSAYFTAFVTALATRYKGKIAYYGLWNEPYFTSYWSGTPQQMVYLAKGAYAAIKAADPNAVVLSPTSTSDLGGGVPAWFDQFLALGGAAYFDVLDMHAYPVGSPPQPPEYFSNMLAINSQALASVSSSAPIFVTEFSNSTTAAIADPIYLAVDYILGWADGASRVIWYQYDNAAGGLNIGNLQGGNQGLNAAGAAYRVVTSWLLNSTWTAAPARQVTTNGIRNTTMAGASAGTPGAVPTNWQSSYPDSAKGISVQLGTCTVGANNCINWRVSGTETAGGSGITGICFEQDGHISASQGQYWTIKANISLAAGSYTNVVDSYLMLFETPSYQFDFSVAPFQALSPTDQPISNTIHTTAVGTTGVTPCIYVQYAVGNPIDLTLQISTPSADNGTIWQGDLTRGNGASSRIAWDAAGGPTTYATSYNYWRDIAGQTHPVSGGNATLTNSPIILDTAIQGVRF